MYRVRDAQFVGYNKTTGKNQKLAHIDCDALSDLPAYDAIPDTELVMGSTALIIATGDTYMIDSSHTWKEW